MSYHLLQQTVFPNITTSQSVNQSLNRSTTTKTQTHTQGHFLEPQSWRFFTAPNPPMLQQIVPTVPIHTQGDVLDSFISITTTISEP